MPGRLVHLTSLPATELESRMGIRFYGTLEPGVGGSVKFTPEDFLVQEVLLDNEVAEINPTSPQTLEGTGNFLLCVLTKSSQDTLSALNELSRALNINQNRISIAGLKDQRAITAQHITLRHVEAKRLMRIRPRGMQITPIRYVNEPLTARSLLGNRFTIKVRSTEVSHEKLNKSIVRFKAEIDELRGIPNFYGYQRFGTIRPITHIIGKHIVKREFEQAVLTYLTTSSLHEPADTTNAKLEFLEKRNAKESLLRYPRTLVYERILLEHLSRIPDDYVGALRKLPIRLRRLLVNAYESFLFNEFLSERSLQGLPLGSARQGDYIMDLDNDGLPTGNVKIVKASSLEADNESLNNGRKTLALPVVGYGTELSEGPQGDIEKKILKREDVRPRSFYVGPLHEASSSGKYRTALVRIRDFEARVERGDKPDMVLRFFLPKESYATIVLREIMKPTDIIRAGF